MAKLNNSTSEGINIKKLITGVIAVCILLVVSFYFLAGDQLLFCDSRGNLDMPAAEASTTELSAGVVIEQRFYAPIQRLENISVQLGTHYRSNAGTVSIALLREDTGERPIPYLEMHLRR